MTGKPIQPEQLKTYAEVLAQYHLSCEDRFDNGQFRDPGRTEGRNVVATRFVWIGKGANQVGESGEADPIWSAISPDNLPYCLILLILAPCSDASPIKPVSPKTKTRTGFLSVSAS